MLKYRIEAGGHRVRFSVKAKYFSLLRNVWCPTTLLLNAYGVIFRRG
jgi:hypothetical protein